MTQQSNLSQLFTRIGQDIKLLETHQGVLSTLTTLDKSNLVQAINEVKASVSNFTQINDADPTATVTTLSASEIVSRLGQVKADIMGGIPATALDTISELATALEADQSGLSALLSQLNTETTRATNAEAALSTSISSLSTAISDEVTRSTSAEATLSTAITTETSRALAAEALTTANLGALVTALGAVDHDFVADYVAGKA